MPVSFPFLTTFSYCSTQNRKRQQRRQERGKNGVIYNYLYSLHSIERWERLRQRRWPAQPAYTVQDPFTIGEDYIYRYALTQCKLFLLFREQLPFPVRIEDLFDVISAECLIFKQGISQVMQCIFMLKDNIPKKKKGEIKCNLHLNIISKKKESV